LHCDVDAVFFLLLLDFLDFATAPAVVVSVVPFEADPFDDDALLLGVEVGGLSESRSQCESVFDTESVDGCSCLKASRDAASLDLASLFT
jgi:hypothetical protein